MTTDEITLWEGTSQSLTSLASGGKVSSGVYRLTNRHLHVERGILSTDAQQLPVESLRDVDVRQSMTQKARGVGDVIVHVDRVGGTDSLVMDSIRDFKAVRDLINKTAFERRLESQQRANTLTYTSGPPVPVAPAAPAAPAGPDVIGLLKQLGELRDAGVLTPAEFDAKKADLLSRL